VAIKIIALVAAMYAAVLLVKNKAGKILVLFLLDAAAVTALSLSGAATAAIAALTALSMVLSSVILLIPDPADKPPAFKPVDFIFMCLAAGVPVFYAVVFAGSGSGFSAVTRAKAPHPALFMVFCAVFTAMYFVIREKTGEQPNE